MEYLLVNLDEVVAWKEKSADFICRKYNWDKVVEETIDLYQKRKG